VRYNVDRNTSLVKRLRARGDAGESVEAHGSKRASKAKC
jgi:hypothetical protein